MDVKKNIIILAVLWVVVIIGSMVWNYYGSKTEETRHALLTARNFFDQIVITRKWNISHGGLYSLGKGTTEVDQDTINKEEVIIDDSHRLTKINPAFMTRQISEIAEESNGIKFHITSLKPFRPGNKATLREVSYLKKFEQGAPEGGEFFNKDGKRFFFYMAPLVTERGCLKCHAEQGYQLGDVRGGISVTVPFHGYVPIVIIFASHIIIGLMGLAGLGLIGRKLTTSFAVIKRQAVMDALTGIANWRSFRDTIDREFNRSRREKEHLSLIMADIDNFKDYNDLYGHSAGDDCLVNVARGVSASLRRPGDFCARYGGEEFVVILSNTGRPGALRVAERIRDTIQEMRIRHSDSPPARVVTVSLGVAVLDDTIASYKELIQNADTALYQAKKSGKNRVQPYLKRSAGPAT